MTHAEAESLAAILLDAYPGTYFDGATRETFLNSMLVSDVDIATEAVRRWSERSEHFPTAAEINSEISRVRGTHQQAAPERRAIQIADKEEAAAAFSHGYIRARTEAGESMETIQPKLDRLLRQWGLHPTSEEGPHEHTGSGPKPTVPSRHRPGYLRSSSAPAVDQPAFDASSTDEPW